MTDPRSHHHYWDEYVDDDGQWSSARRPAGEDLAAMRSGLGKPAGQVARMWRLHRVAVPDDQLDRPWLPPRYVAEHHALTLYGVHQQSRTGLADLPAHRPGVRVGRAMRQLHAGPRDEERSKAIDRRFYAAVTATSVDEVAYHLRGLVRLLRSVGASTGLDYGWLVRDLARWHNPAARDLVRRRWGLSYHAPAPSPSEDAAASDDPVRS